MKCAGAIEGERRRAVAGGRRFLAGLLLGATFCLLPGCQPGGGYGSPEERDRNIQTGIAARIDGRHDDAEKAFLRALQNQPNSALAHWNLGSLYFNELKDYTAALYHFDRFSRLQPKEKTDQVKWATEACKQELAKGVPLGSIPDLMQRQINGLVRSNAALRAEVDRLRQDLAQRQAAGNQTMPDRQARQLPSAEGAAPLSRAAPPADARARDTAPPSGRLSGMSAAPRTHRIQRGETMASVARAYGLDLQAVIAANPGVIPNRMQPGQLINLPAR
jgi:LysM repeat protein